MSDLVLEEKPTTTFWIFSGAALVWNLLGLVAYISYVTMSPEALAQMTAFALAVNAGVLGSLFLLLRKAWAVPMFVLSLVCVVAQNIDAFLLRDAFAIMGVNSLIMPSAIFVVAILLLIYSINVKGKRWLT
jgi:hypothetical protein